LSDATRNTAASQRDAARAIEVLDQAARVLHREVSRFQVTTAPSSPTRPEDTTRPFAAAV
jgi:hypothetical protein